MNVLSSNVSSLNVIRHLNDSTARLQDSLGRLSSGLRINSAKDDPAGLALAESIRADRRVYLQGIRNINDGISRLSVMEAAASELKNILFRITELAHQAANGTLSSSQRKALNQESEALTAEYNRIMQASEFNGVKVLSEQGAVLRIQTGYGENGSITLTTEGIGLTGGVGDTGGPSGDGTFGAHTPYAVGSNPQSVSMGDFNGDGVLDLVVANWFDNNLSVLLGNGDGTFKAQTTYSVGNSPGDVAVVDLNGDGILDLVASNVNSASVSVRLGLGDGTFGGQATYTVGAGARSISIGDFNGDGVPDVVTVTANSSVSVLLGNGNGSFTAQTSYSVGAGPGPQRVTVGDFNNDGVLDIVTANENHNYMSILLGVGDGTFGAHTTFSGGSYPTAVSVGDFNGDGNLDLVTVSDGVSVLLGNGDGGFAAAANYGAGFFPTAVSVGDFNGDGILDLVTTNNSPNSLGIFLGNGDGTFGAQATFGTGAGPRSIAIGDLNGDGISDVVIANAGSSDVGVLLGNAAAQSEPGVYLSLQPLQGVNLLTESSARNSIPVVEAHLDDVRRILGFTGAGINRLEVAARKQMIETENLAAAESRVRDLDVALEVARLMKYTIRQQAAVSVLGIANMQPSIALDLLSITKT